MTEEVGHSVLQQMMRAANDRHFTFSAVWPEACPAFFAYMNREG